MVTVSTPDDKEGIGGVTVEAPSADAAKQAFAQVNGTTIQDIEQSGLTKWRVQEAE